MAMILEDQIMDKALGLTDGQKALRPWWDIIEDVCMYSIIMTGLIAYPTAALTSSPIVCIRCVPGVCPDNNNNTYNPPAMQWLYVKNYCTVYFLDRFILYFPYILLAIGFFLIGIERMFRSIVKGDRKVDLFYNLIVKESLENMLDLSKDVIEESRYCLEVLYSFREKDNFFRSYVYRTIMQIIVSVMTFIIFFWMGVASLSKGDIMYCDFHGYFYECTGFHSEFHGILFGMALIHLAGYIISNLYNLTWLLLPNLGKMSRLMKGLKDYGSSNLQEIYYHNRDLALMLDLLAENSGVAPALRILGLFDTDFRNTIEVSRVFVERRVGARGDGEIWVKFSEAVHASKLITHSKFIPSILYTVEVLPHTKLFGIETFSSASNYFKNLENEIIGKKEDYLNYTSVIRDADPSEPYTIVISTVINGKTVARVIEKIQLTKV